MVGPEWIYGVAGTICALIAGAQMPLFALGVTQALVSYYMDWDTTTREVKKISLLFCGGAAITVIVHVITHLSFGIMGERLTLRMREMMFSAILKNELGWFDDVNNTSSMLASRLEGDATLLRNVVVDRSTVLIQNSGLVVTSFVIAFMLDWRIALVVMATYPLIISGHLSEKMFMKGYGGNLSKAYLKANMLASESVSNIRTVIAFCSEEKVLDLYAQELVDPSRKSLTRGQIAGIFYGVTQFFIFSSYGLALCCDGIGHGLTGLAMGSTLAMVPDLLKGNQMVASVFEVLDREAEVIGDSGEELARVEGTIELRGVQFSYPSRPDELIFVGLDLIVCAGQSMALVGRSGSGKSSVLALVLRFYHPIDGNVMIDGFSFCIHAGFSFCIIMLPGFYLFFIDRTSTRSRTTKQFLLITAFKKYVQLPMLDFLLPVSGTNYDITQLPLRIEAFVTIHKGIPSDDQKLCQLIWFKPSATDVQFRLKQLALAWSFNFILISQISLLIGLLTRYYIKPVDHDTNMRFLYKAKSALNMLTIYISKTTTQQQLLLGARIATTVQRIYHRVLVSGPKKMRQDVAAIFSSHESDNLHFKSISFSW
ncbi:hypothetical protein RHSIM_Rhsim07G0129100 [Rhododendron simsii]|uniref:ABC transmembrane type-1 domain-containing protein n=1 Tax=Rhododendron simsii TaxID=118357 RepID=A0A834GUE8_RHOSS|nr:hypothetical protein RHSIM_Rhsim07G0129100 [Rhododendron simsii]